VWFDVYAAVAPTTGERVCLEPPDLKAEMFQLFLEAFAHADPDSRNIPLLDNRGTRTAQRLCWPAPACAVQGQPMVPSWTPFSGSGATSKTRWRGANFPLSRRNKIT
jgi:hypothetical protein